MTPQFLNVLGAEGTALQVQFPALADAIGRTPCPPALRAQGVSMFLAVSACSMLTVGLLLSMTPAHGSPLRPRKEVPRDGDANEASPQQAAGYHKEGHCL
jgi:hypothetical protein